MVDAVLICLPLGMPAGGVGGAAISFGAVGKTKRRLLRPCIERLWLCVSKRGLGNRSNTQCAVRRGLCLHIADFD